jgi:transcriptional regulator with XRE-family HTH domain
MQHKLQNKFPITGSSYWEVVDKYLFELDLSITDFCEKADLDRSQISNAISKKSNPQPKTKRKVENTLDIIIKDNTEGIYFLYDHGFAFQNAEGKKFDKIMMEEKLRSLFKQMDQFNDTFDKAFRAKNLDDEEKEMIYIGLKAKLIYAFKKFDEST